MPPPAVHRVRWQNRRVRGSGGKLFNEAVILARGGTRCYLLLRLLAHDKPHVATMLACRVREDRVSGVMVQEPDAHVVIKVGGAPLGCMCPSVRAPDRLRRGRPNAWRSRGAGWGDWGWVEPCWEGSRTLWDGIGGRGPPAQSDRLPHPRLTLRITRIK